MSDEVAAIKAAIAEWEQKPGPCVGDYCELKNGTLRRIAAMTALLALLSPWIAYSSLPHV